MPAKKSSATPAVERIREIAYQLWLEAGQPEGQDTAHWFVAETMATSEMTSAPAPTKRKAAPRKKAA